MKNKNFVLKFSFLVVKLSIYLNRLVFVTRTDCYRQDLADGLAKCLETTAKNEIKYKKNKNKKKKTKKKKNNNNKKTNKKKKKKTTKNSSKIVYHFSQLPNVQCCRTVKLKGHAVESRSYTSAEG